MGGDDGVTNQLIAQKILKRAPQPGDAFTTDIAQAWSVLQWLIDLLGPEATVSVAYQPEFEHWVCAARELTTDGPPLVSEVGETAPQAICGAALQAYGKHVLEFVREQDDRRREQQRRDHLKLE